MTAKLGEVIVQGGPNKGRLIRGRPLPGAADLPDFRVDHEHPVVPPQVSHLRHVPLRTRVKLPHSPQASPS
jgi:hypothetical protein